MAAPDRARPLGQRLDAHRRRRSRAGLRAARRAAALGRRLDARERALKSCRWRSSAGRASMSPCAFPACSATCFREQIALFDAAVRARRARLDEAPEDNPLRGRTRDAASRIFGAAPGAYGVDLSRRARRRAMARPRRSRRGHISPPCAGYGRDGAPLAGAGDFAARVAAADAFVHVQDMAGQDVLDADAFADHEGGFAAAADLLGASPALYHVDATRPGRRESAQLDEEIARVVRARADQSALDRRQMRHGAQRRGGDRRERRQSLRLRGD